MTYKRSYHHDVEADHICSDEDIADLIREIEEIEEDPNLSRYENPSENEMVNILEKAATYTGPWYHTTVLFDMEALVPEEYKTLRTGLLNLPVSKGVYTVTRYTTDSELDNILPQPTIHVI